MGLAMGKMILGGKVIVETPKYEVLHTGSGYEVRKYPPCVSAEVTYDPKEMNGDRHGGFSLLANYIGAFGSPQNSKPEQIAMTAPVITAGGAAEPEPIAMTAPVITAGGAAEPEPIAMTAPVITKSGTAEPEPVAMTAPVITAAEGNQTGKVTMQFLLPSIYRKAEEAPRPTDKRVVLREEAERKYGVVRFSGLPGDKVVKEKAEGLKAALEKDGFTVKGPFVLSRYNPPYTLPPLRTNEVMIPVE